MSTAIRPGQKVYWNDEEGVWFPKEVAHILYKMLTVASNVEAEEDHYGEEHCAICKAEREQIPVFGFDEDGDETDEVVDWETSEDFDHEPDCPASIAWYYLTHFPESPHYRFDFQRPLPGIHELEEMTTE